MRRRAARIDENQPAIVKALEKCGALVLSLASMGKGVADLLVLFRGRLILLEVKNPAKPKSDRKLTPEQIEWHKLWPVVVVQTAAEAIEAIQNERLIRPVWPFPSNGKLGGVQ